MIVYKHEQESQKKKVKRIRRVKKKRRSSAVKIKWKEIVFRVTFFFIVRENSVSSVVKNKQTKKVKTKLYRAPNTKILSHTNLVFPSTCFWFFLNIYQWQRSTLTLMPVSILTSLSLDISFSSLFLDCSICFSFTRFTNTMKQTKEDNSNEQFVEIQNKQNNSFECIVITYLSFIQIWVSMRVTGDK